MHVGVVFVVDIVCVVRVRPVAIRRQEPGLTGATMPQDQGRPVATRRQEQGLTGATMPQDQGRPVATPRQEQGSTTIKAHLNYQAGSSHQKQS